MRPRLTALCITKDQASKLMRMLQSMQGVADDIIVVDTGSKDLSVGVAKLHGARVFEIEWPNSFSDALNHGLKEVQTEWVLRIDTDEWVMPECGQRMREIIENELAFAYFLVRRDLVADGSYSESRLLRLWRNDPKLRFHGIIHERLPDHLIEQFVGKRKVMDAPVYIMHDGFVDGNSEVKMRRNIPLLRRELELRPGQLYYEVDLVLSELLVKEPGALDRLQSLAERVLRDYPAERPPAYTANVLGTALSNIPTENLAGERAQRMLEKCWEWFNASPPMLWSLAQTELRRGNTEGMYRVLLRLEELSESNAYEKEQAFDGRMLRDGLWEYLAQVADSLGHKDVADRNRARLALAQK